MKELLPVGIEENIADEYYRLNNRLDNRLNT
jgi:hypothetical protein